MWGKISATIALLMILSVSSAFAAPEDITLIVDPVRDIQQGDAIYYPVTIANTGGFDELVTLGLEDVQPWASFRVDPSPTLLVPAGEQTQAFIFLKVADNAETGLKRFTITAERSDAVEQAQLQVAILQGDTPSLALPWWGALIIILVLIAAAIAAYFVYFREEEDEILITHY